ncbi:hypothetical protein B0A52_03166 [Exophiala mesophila]|uniref:Histidine kinase n=1 Tax=Exophiala mesophila TaxID=212818 RepID=A0A438NAM4_EXOME|nr:hypothetical protein B0A52_03166 [Exophiala mesophila]
MSSQIPLPEPDIRAEKPADAIRRAREFYRYLEPQDVDHDQSRSAGTFFTDQQKHLPKLSSSLTPYCQLVALRCNAPKVMLSFIDRETMYILAEACQDPHGARAFSTFEFTEDPILSSCASMPAKDRVCEMTIALNPLAPEGRLPIFQISDMRASRFASVPVVAGPPYYRFYAGTPITTRDQINIGSLSVMDTKVRERLTQQEEAFLYTTARQIMTHLETNREAIEGRRSRRMAHCMNAFIAGRNSLQEHREQNRGSRSSRTNRRPSLAPGEAPINPSDRPSESASEGGISSDGHDNSIDQQDKLDSRSHTKTLARAANILREAFGEFDQDAAVVFVNLKGTAARHSAHHRSKSFQTSPTELQSPRQKPNSPSNENPESISSPTQYSDEYSIASILASSSLKLDSSEAKPAIPRCLVTDQTLHSLVSRYPGGTVWSFDDYRGSSSDDDDPTFAPRPIKKVSPRRKMEKKILQSAFPDARQLLFAPIWSPSLGTFAHAVFVTISLEVRSLSTSTDLSFINSFCSTLMAECSRIDTMLADKQKDDFVGTISHEMRSPLHGILASTEFLSETELDSFQQTLVETVRSCGQTLLDTINHVLDYSKINTFQKQWQSSQKKPHHKATRKLQTNIDGASKPFTSGAPPLLQLLGVTSISVVLEEVVDGLILGQTYISSGLDMTDLSRSARGRGPERKMSQVDAQDNDVDLYIDIQHADWTFMTQPGAVRRIIQNLVGNALKYCKSGHIIVKLELIDNAPEETDHETMLLTVEDTGCGISQKFMSSRLFLPFAQENSLAPGTGLGLSIVHSIVTMLGGTINVKSVVGRGTTMQVFLPLKRPLPGQVSTNTAPNSGTTNSGSSLGDEVVQTLQRISIDTPVLIFRPRLFSKRDMLAHVLSNYVEDWYGLRLVDREHLHSAQIILVEEDDLDELLTAFGPSSNATRILIVLCSVVSRHSTSYVSKLQHRISGPVEFVSKPCGPYKLAKAVQLSMHRLAGVSQTALDHEVADALDEQQQQAEATQADNALDRLATEGELDNLKEMDLNAPGFDEASQMVQATETLAASQVSQRAQMAISDPSIDQPKQEDEAGNDEYPFPGQSSFQHSSLPHGPAPLVPATPPETPATENIANKIDARTDNPRILVVDDNTINLKLLETFLRNKRKYTDIVCVDDGQKAVDMVTSTSRPFQIIFMDISMPVMNGFEATRAIRDVEATRPGVPGSLIIALTGLASGRDQAEGFESGCDLYLTKPVSFKAVGKLLTNWEMHQQWKP